MKNLTKKIMIGMFLCLPNLLCGCMTGSPNKVQSVETRLEVKGQVGDRKLGINEKNEAIIQEEVLAESELNTQKNVSMFFQEKLDSAVYGLKECLLEKSRKKNGGSGNYPAVPTATELKNLSEIREEFGITEDGSLKVIRKSSFIEELKKERLVTERIRKELANIKDLAEKCEFDKEDNRYEQTQRNVKLKAQILMEYSNRLEPEAPKDSVAPSTPGNKKTLQDRLNDEVYGLEQHKS